MQDDVKIIKICGLTTVADALLVAGLGADMIGLNFSNTSKRQVDPAIASEIVAALPAGSLPVGVFTEVPIEDILRIAERTKIRWLQLHFEADAALMQTLGDLGYKVIRALGWTGNDTADRINSVVGGKTDSTNRDVPPHWLLLDTPAAGTNPKGGFGGSGKSWDWSHAADLRLSRPWLLAGGLKPGNVAEAIALANPNGVDVAGGVESAPGVKSPIRLRDFISQARGAFVRNSLVFAAEGIETSGECQC